MTKPIVGILHPGADGRIYRRLGQKQRAHVYWASEGRSAEAARGPKQAGLHDAGYWRRCAQAATSSSAFARRMPPKPLAHERAGRRVYAASTWTPTPSRRSGRSASAPGDGRRRGRRSSMAHHRRPGLAARQPGSICLARTPSCAATCFSAGACWKRCIWAKTSAKPRRSRCASRPTPKARRRCCAPLLAAAEALDVRDALERSGRTMARDFAAQTAAARPARTAKAWRFAGEMDEIAATFQRRRPAGRFSRRRCRGLPPAGGLQRRRRDTFAGSAHRRPAQAPEMRHL